MIGGRLNGNTAADRICCAAPNTWRMTAWTLSAAACRSAKGFNLVTRKAEFGWLAPSSREKPTIASTRSTCGNGRRIPSICFTTARVRETDAPSGNCTETKNTPWSSSGRKPVGVIRPKP